MPEKDNYLIVQPEDKIFDFVNGDGTEEGFIIRVKYYSSSPGKSIVEIPTPDNRADARLASISKNSTDNTDDVSFDIKIDTSVEADTGGCLVWVKKPNGETIVIISYGYVTDM